MPGEVPFFIEGVVVEFLKQNNLVIAKVENGNLYHLLPNTPGLIFEDLRKDQRVTLEVTNMLTRVLSARIIYD